MKINEELIAPCGMNCRICLAFFGYTMNGKKRKMKCIGCNPSGKSCAHIKKFCEKLMKKEIKYCYECNVFPCEYLKRLDNKYQERFNMSMIENLRELKEKGMNEFLKNQEEKYRCPVCGDLICIHTQNCYNCDENV